LAKKHQQIISAVCRAASSSGMQLVKEKTVRISSRSLLRAKGTGRDRSGQWFIGNESAADSRRPQPPMASRPGWIDQSQPQWAIAIAAHTRDFVGLGIDCETALNFDRSMPTAFVQGQ